ncbi:MAG: CooT family nickel-binding protein [Desulfobacterales bacterium]|jgi:predicted RNA-binding protein
MCEANAYIARNDKKELVLKSVDIVKPLDDGYLLVDIFGTRKTVKGRLKQMNLVNHEIIFEE